MGLIGADAEQQERLVDELLAEQQLSGGGMLGSVCHLDDGDVPQEAEAVVGDASASGGCALGCCAGESGQLGHVGRSTLGAWVEGDLEGTSGQRAGGVSQLSPELVTLAESLLRLIGPTAEAAVQTGGVKDSGRVVRGGPQGGVPKV